MDIMKIIKPSVSIPNNTLIHRSSNRTKFKICSLTVQKSRPSIYHTATISRLVPLFATNYKPNTTSTRFQCCCSKEDNYVETTTDSDTGVRQRCNLKLQTPLVWLLLFEAIKSVSSAISKLIPRPIYLSFMIYVDTLKLRYGSKKKEPMNISFDDLVGVDATIRKFQNTITTLKEKRKDDILLPAGVILYGPPGTGKGTFVHALARETNVSFFHVYAHHIEEGDVRIERIFDEARACSPSIVYIRYLKVITKQGDKALFQLHTEMEKCKDNGSVVIVIVSSHNLDPFWLDSHMFLDQVHVGKPDEDARRKVIGLHLKRVLREEDKEAFCEIVASQTPGLPWRELGTLANICELCAKRRGDVYVNMDDVFEALERINNNVPSNLDKPMALEDLRRRVESIAFGSQK